MTGNRKRKTQEEDDSIDEELQHDSIDEELQRKRAMSRLSSAKHRNKERNGMAVNLKAQELLQKNNELLKKENAAIRAKIAAVKEFKAIQDQQSQQQQQQQHQLRLLRGVSGAQGNRPTAPSVASLLGASPPPHHNVTPSPFLSRTNNTASSVLLSNRAAVSPLDALLRRENLAGSDLLRCLAAEQRGANTPRLQDTLQLLLDSSSNSRNTNLVRGGQGQQSFSMTPPHHHFQQSPTAHLSASSSVARLPPQHYVPTTTASSSSSRHGHGHGTHAALAQLILLEKVRAQQQQQQHANSMVGFL